MEDVVIVSGARTPIGTFGGSLKKHSASELGAEVIKETVKRAGVDSNIVEEVIMGCVGQIGEDAYLARMSGIKAGLPIETTAQTVNRLCSSGLQAIVTGMTTIQSGMADVVIAGGAESMSNFPYLTRDARWGLRMGDKPFEDVLTTILSDPFDKVHMGVTAENVATKYNVSREEQDQFALYSQNKAIKAIKSGKFKEQIVPIKLKSKKEEINYFSTDEHPRDNITMESLAKLKPAFKKEGSVTAGNSSGINDGAAAMMLMSQTKAQELNIQPMTKIIGASVAGVEPSLMGTGPIPAVKRVLEKSNLTLNDIDIIESNEAFASQAIAVSNELGLSADKVNVDGGAIALGHPIGATGCIISIKLIYEMINRKLKYGLATLCIGGGQGLAVIYENIQN